MLNYVLCTKNNPHYMESQNQWSVFGFNSGFASELIFYRGSVLVSSIVENVRVFKIIVNFYFKESLL